MTEQTITAEQAAAVLEQGRQERLARCQQAVAAALKANGCKLVAVPVISPDGRVLATVQMVVE